MLEWLIIIIALQLMFISTCFLATLAVILYVAFIAPPPAQQSLPMFLTMGDDVLKKSLNPKPETAPKDIPPTHGMYA